MSDLGKRLGRRIYEFRKQRQLTQARVAERAGISNEFMSSLERGAKLPSLSVLERIADTLKIELKDLFDFDQSGHRRLRPLSREVLDLATEITQLPPEDRKKLRMIAKILSV